MEENKKQIDLEDLVNLAQSRNIRVVEAEGLDQKCGIRFKREESEYIAINSSLPDNEKVRALGYLLENDPSSIGATLGAGLDEPPSKDIMSRVFSLECPTS